MGYKEPFDKAVEELAIAVRRAGEAMTCLGDPRGGRGFAAQALVHVDRARELSKDLPYEQRRLIAQVAGGVYHPLRETFGDLSNIRRSETA